MGSSNPVFNWLPCAVVFITTAHGGRRDIMTATAMFVSEKEPLIAISVADGHLTEKLIGASGKFTAVIAGEGQKKLAAQVGSVKGEDVDKFEKFAIQTDKNLVPVGSAAWFACTVVKTIEITGYRIVIGRILDQVELDEHPLIWRKNTFFSLNPV